MVNLNEVNWEPSIWQDIDDAVVNEIHESARKTSKTLSRVQSLSMTSL
jgi:hypothetical protein